MIKTFLAENYYVLSHDNGDKCYYLNDQLHREDGPALEYTSGTKHWYINGRLHRIDGPAWEFWDGDKRWYFHGKEIEATCQEEFEKLLRLKAFW